MRELHGNQSEVAHMGYEEETSRGSRAKLRWSSWRNGEIIQLEGKWVVSFRFVDLCFLFC